MFNHNFTKRIVRYLTVFLFFKIMQGTHEEILKFSEKGAPHKQHEPKTGPLKMIDDIETLLKAKK